MLTKRGCFLGSGLDSDDGLDGVALYHEFKFNTDGKKFKKEREKICMQ